MPLKVTWKKGMRLSTDVFDAMDVTADDTVTLSNVIATGGRYGLIPAKKPFELSVNISNNMLEVVSLSCHGVTRSGKIIDINFDSNFANTFDARVPMPVSDGNGAFLLSVRLHDKEWREVNEFYSEPKYTFELIGENSPVDRDSLPVGLVVNQYGWRLDESEFVPPCLYTNAHPAYVDLVNRAKLILKSISDRCLSSQNCVARHLLGEIWPAALHNFIFIDKMEEALAPADLFAAVQKVVASFMIGCTIDEFITLENAEPFVAYSLRPYDARNIYRDIRNGLDLCAEISIKMDAVCDMTEVREAPPVEKPKPRPQPRPKPQPEPEPEPQPKGRNRWEGIEI